MAQNSPAQTLSATFLRSWLEGVFSRLSFSEVEAANGAPDDLRLLVRGVLVADKDAAFKEARPHLQPPGVEGSTAWDNKAVVDIILRHDKLHTVAILVGVIRIRSSTPTRRQRFRSQPLFDFFSPATNMEHCIEVDNCVDEYLYAVRRTFLRQPWHE